MKSFSKRLHQKDGILEDEKRLYSLTQELLDDLYATSSQWNMDNTNAKGVQLNIVQIQGHGVIHDNDNYLVVPDLLE